MDSKNYIFNNIEEDLKKDICQALSKVPLLTDLATQDLSAQNSKKFRFWDELATLLCNGKDIKDARVYLTKSGCWEFAIIVKHEDVFVFMRETRFAKLQKDHDINSNLPHYCVSLAKILNVDIEEDEAELFPDYTKVNPSYSENVVKRVLRPLYQNGESINNFYLVLFNQSVEIITSARIVMLNANFRIHREENISRYLTNDNSGIITDVVTKKQNIAKKVKAPLSLKVLAQKESEKNLKLRNNDTEKIKE